MRLDEAEAKAIELLGPNGVVWQDQPIDPDVIPLCKVGIANGVLRDVYGWGFTWEAALIHAASWQRDPRSA